MQDHGENPTLLFLKELYTGWVPQKEKVTSTATLDQTMKILTKL